MINSKFLNKNKTIIIAEACDNHFGSLDNAKEMVINAKKAGADVIKFQHHLPDEEMLPVVPRSKNFKISLYDFLKKYSLKIKDHYDLKIFCKKKKIEYLCTPFSFKAAEDLNEIGVKWFKMGSGEFTDLPFLEKLLKFNKPTILSTGMSTQKEIHMVYKFILSQNNKKVAFMNCTSEYPPIYKDINLNYIPKMIKDFSKIIVGHSDHTNNIFTSFGAVSLGAKIIEKHVNLKNKNFGPDKDVSIGFEEFRQLVEGIRIIEQSLGKDKRIYPKERSIRKWARRSLVSIKNIPKNKIIDENDIWTKRPGTGIPSYLMKKVLGKRAKANIKINKLIKRNQIK
jgi:sialic acid synthase SpsE